MDNNTEKPNLSRIIGVPIEQQMKESYIDYAMSVIVSRALPDVRDGLKPVHRRILYTMGDLGLNPDKAHRKCAKIVGDVMGRFHPHGDSAIYDTLARLAQDFNMRYRLVDGHGNFGSIDGDRPAAMRYTEARLNKPSVDLLSDIKMNTVDFIDNYDNTEKEPVVLPAKFPNLLINGTSGIAVGMATSIPPHNFGEVIDATIAIIDDPDIETEELCRIIPGPDFPTGGEIIGKSGIREAYHTGRGRVTLRGIITSEEAKNGREWLIITEIPYTVNKSSLLESIAELVKEKRIEGISDIRDESDRDGMRVVIELKKDANSHVIKNLLFKYTQLQTTFSIIMIALHDNKPITHTLKEIFQHFITHRREVVRRRTQFELDRARERAHILEGLKIALDNLDDVIATIRASKDDPEAKASLIQKFTLSEIQAQAILDLRLRRLTSLERNAIIEEYQNIIKKIADLEDILANAWRIDSIIKNELLEVKSKYNDPRRTQIVAGEADFDIEDLIQKEDTIITITRDGWIKRLPMDTFRTQGRGGRGIIGLTTKQQDDIKNIFVTSSHDYILFFTSRGRVLRLKGYQIPQSGRTAKGTPIVNLLELNPDERVTTSLPITSFSDQHYLFMVTKNGTVKKTNLSQYHTNRKGGIRAIELIEGDDLIQVLLTDGQSHIILGTRKGLSIRFSEQDVRPMGRTATGVMGIRLNPDDAVIGAGVIRPATTLLCVCENGYGKQTPLDLYRPQHRGGKGILTIKVSERNGDVIGIAIADIDEELMIISEQGIVIRSKISDITTVGRNTQGVRLMRLAENDKVVAFEVFKPDTNTDDTTENDTPDTENSDTTNPQNPPTDTTTLPSPTENDPE